MDSLLERTEAIGSKTVETFEGRDDQLMYRSVRYGSVERQQSDLKYAPACACVMSLTSLKVVAALSPQQSLLLLHAFLWLKNNTSAHIQSMSKLGLRESGSSSFVSFEEVLFSVSLQVHNCTCKRGTQLYL